MENLALMPKYEEYKKTYIHSVELIPFGWNILRFHDVFSFSKGLNITKENLQDDGVPCLNYGEIHSKYGFELRPEIHPLKCVDEKYLKNNKKSILRFGDFIFADTSEDYEGAGNFTYLNSEDEIFAGYHTLICRLKENANKRFLAYVIDSNAFRLQIRRAVKGVKVFSITQSILKGAKLWLASEKEQTLIANFLDKKTDQINEAIAIKEQQISLLKERKQIIIQQAVTQGLDPNVPMKDSGVDWIGKIPAHWEVRRAKYIFKKENRPVRLEDDVVTCFRDGQVTLRTNRRIEGFTFATKEHGYQGIRNGDLVIHAMDAFAGAIGVSDSDGKSSPVYSACTPVTGVEVNPKYYALYLRNLALGGFIESLAKGIRERSTDFRYKDFSELFFPLPDIETQNKVVLEIEKSHREIDGGISILTKQIEKIKEYKTSLINSAVTGKIKITPEMVEQ